jgi:hypothetical protein
MTTIHIFVLAVTFGAFVVLWAFFRGRRENPPPRPPRQYQRAPCERCRRMVAVRADGQPILGRHRCEIGPAPLPIDAVTEASPEPSSAEPAAAPSVSIA